MAGAREYYEARANRLGLTEQLPPVLMGETIALMDDGTTLPLYDPSSKRAEAVTERYAAVLQTVTPYVIAAARQQFPAAPPEIKPTRSITQHLDNWVRTRLFPKSIKVGHIDNVRIAAVTHSDVPDTLVTTATSSLQEARAPNAENRSVYFMTRGTLHDGKSELGLISCLTIVYVSSSKDDRLALRYLAASDHQVARTARRRHGGFRPYQKASTTD